jgi:hypothetical protein
VKFGQSFDVMERAASRHARHGAIISEFTQFGGSLVGSSMTRQNEMKSILQDSGHVGGNQ